MNPRLYGYPMYHLQEGRYLTIPLRRVYRIRATILTMLVLAGAMFSKNGYLDFKYYYLANSTIAQNDKKELFRRKQAFETPIQATALLTPIEACRERSIF